VVLTGRWRGFLTQKANGIAPYYPFELEITAQQDQKVKGFTIIRLTTTPKYYGKMAFPGTWDNKNQVLMMNESVIVEQELGENMYWCIKKAKLQYSFSTKSTLKGNWWRCVPNSTQFEGQIELVKE
jgi:glutathionyl-hydroquinone reductase